MGLIEHKINELFKPHRGLDPNKKEKLQNISRGYGLLLHFIGAKSVDAQTLAVSDICKKVLQ